MDLASRKQWIDRAIQGIEIHSVSELTDAQKNGISIQFMVLMDQMDVAVSALEEIISGGLPVGDACLGCKEVAHKTSLAVEALEKMKSSQFSI